jgi:hypothetical protein
MSDNAPKRWSQVGPWVTGTVLAAVLPTAILSYFHLNSSGPKVSPPAVAPTHVPAPEACSVRSLVYPGKARLEGQHDALRLGVSPSPVPTVVPTFIPAPEPRSARSLVYPRLEGPHEGPHPGSSSRPNVCIK